MQTKSNKSNKSKADRKITVNVLVNSMNLNDKSNIFPAIQHLIERNNIEGIDLNDLVKMALDKYGLDPTCGIEVDYWSNLMQTFVMCGIYDPQEDDDVNFLSEEELLLHMESSCLILRFKNCTGNVIDFSEPDRKEDSPKEDDIEEQVKA